MLHVFNMDVGTMIGFDTQFAMQNVQRLQEEIKEEIGVGEADQVRLSNYIIKLFLLIPISDSSSQRRLTFGPDSTSHQV